MRAEQQSLSAEPSLPQTERLSSHGHTGSLCCCRQRVLLCRQDVVLVKASEQGIGVGGRSLVTQLEQPSGMIRHSFFQVSSNSSSFH